VAALATIRATLKKRAKSFKVFVVIVDSPVSDYTLIFSGYGKADTTFLWCCQLPGDVVVSR
jgi:hypothetical protein